jgi:hypothetical protein
MVPWHNHAAMNNLPRRREIRDFGRACMYMYLIRCYYAKEKTRVP